MFSAGAWGRAIIVTKSRAVCRRIGEGLKDAPARG